MDKLSGGEPPHDGSLLEAIFENVDKLSENLELESVTMLSEPLHVPINIVNKPLTNAEVAI
jgi:hypothetical protein